MIMAAAIESRTAGAPVLSTSRRIAQIDILSDLESAEAAWRCLETAEQLSTAYQRSDFLKCWQREVGLRDDAKPLIVIASDAERRPLLLLPLVLKQSHGVRVASFMGGKHATFNMALWDRSFAVAVEHADLHGLLDELRQRSAADVLALTQQPLRWRDVQNPLALLPHQPSVNDCPVLNMEPGAAPSSLISNSFRRRLRAKERKLTKLPGYRHHLATEDAEIDHLLEWFFRTKPLRMAQQGLPNVFAERGVEAFIRKACLTRRFGEGRVIDMHALECDEEIIALYAGVADGWRFSMMFNTYTLSDHSRYSPGLILIRNIVDHYAARGYRALDLGIGADDYKHLFCKAGEPIFDSFIPLTSRGRLAAAGMSALACGKHLVKHNQALFRLAQGVRKALR
jgi:CelD/BcsL family acetyltransferase involved in cellulose biosynthesis